MKDEKSEWIVYILSIVSGVMITSFIGSVIYGIIFYIVFVVIGFSFIRYKWVSKWLRKSTNQKKVT